MIMCDKDDMTIVEINDMFREIKRFQKYYYNLESELANKTTRINQLEKELEKYKSICYNLKKNLDSYEDTEEHEESYTDEEKHYKPGDTIIFKRFHEIDRTNRDGAGFESLNEYVKLVKHMMESNMFVVEIPEPDIIDRPNLPITIDNVFGHVVSFDKTTITVKTLPEQIMPESGRIILEKLTKKDIDDYILICHRKIIKHPEYPEHKRTSPIVTKIISCYLIDKRFKPGEGQLISNDLDILANYPQV